MFVINEDKSIYVTRGDVLFFNVSAAYRDGTAYTFNIGDTVRIRVYEKKACENVVISKDFLITAAAETVEIFLDERDTKIGDVISKPVDYWYEIELNPGENPQTLVGYDDDGAKIFRLFPEGKDLTDGELPNDEIRSEVTEILIKVTEKYFIEQPVKEVVYEYLEQHPVKDGLSPYVGANGNWWLGATDTGIKAQARDGKDGKDGKDGITPKLRVNGTTKLWEVSYDDGVTWGSLGVIANAASGKDGKDGQDGYTPVKGKDYFTEEDKKEMLERLQENLPGQITVTLDTTNVLASHSATEIKEHINKGGSAVLNDGKPHFLHSVGTDHVVFSNTTVSDSGVSSTFYRVFTDRRYAKEEYNPNLLRYSAQLLTDDQKEQARENIGATPEVLAEGVLALVPKAKSIQVLKAGAVVQVNETLDDGSKNAIQITLDAYGRPEVIEEDGAFCYLTWEGFDE